MERKASWRKLRRTLLASCVAAAFGASPLPARAGDTLVVQNCNDSGPGSLRQALLDAGGGELVDLRELDCPLITLSSGELVSVGVRLVGPGQEALAIDAAGSSRVLRHTGGTELFIEDLTLRGGATHDGIGGCIYSVASMVLIRSTVTGCHADDPVMEAAYGGGIRVQGSLRLEGSSVTENTVEGGRAAKGGGIFAGVTATVTHGSVVARNLATGVSGGAYAYGSFGGGILAYTVIVEGHSIIDGNRALSNNHAAAGGGIDSTWLTLDTGSQVSDNVASGFQRSRGGGVTAQHGTISGASITGNRVESTRARASGGGVDSPSGTLEVSNSTISGNVVVSARDASGGGISAGVWGSSQGRVTLADSSVTGNVVYGYCADCDVLGGGIAARSMAIEGSTISGNRLESTGAPERTRGAGLATRNDDPGYALHISNSTVSDNAAGAGGAAGVGGAISTLGTSLVLENSTVAFNRAATAAGGIAIDAGFANTFTSSIVANNDAPSAADIGSLDGAGAVLAGDHDLVGTAAANIVLPVDTLAGDPLLLDLACNGGSTATHALAAGSPAIDAGSNPAALPYDQRGAPWVREAGVRADIGAFEQQAEPGVIFHDGFEVVAGCH